MMYKYTSKSTVLGSGVLPGLWAHQVVGRLLIRRFGAECSRFAQGKKMPLLNLSLPVGYGPMN